MSNPEPTTATTPITKTIDFSSDADRRVVVPKLIAAVQVYKDTTPTGLQLQAELEVVKRALDRSGQVRGQLNGPLGNFASMDRLVLQRANLIKDQGDTEAQRKTADGDAGTTLAARSRSLARQGQDLDRRITELETANQQTLGRLQLPKYLDPKIEAELRTADTHNKLKKALANLDKLDREARQRQVVLEAGIKVEAETSRKKRAAFDTALAGLQTTMSEAADSRKRVAGIEADVAKEQGVLAGLQAEVEAAEKVNRGSLNARDAGRRRNDQAKIVDTKTAELDKGPHPDRDFIKQLKVVRDALPSGAHHRRLLDGLILQTKVDTTEKSIGSIVSALDGQLPQLQRQGGSVKRNVTVAVGVAWENAVRVRTQGVVSVTHSIERTTGGKFKASFDLITGIKGGLKYGIEAAGGNAFVKGQVDAGIGQSRLYDTMDDLLAAEGRYLVDVVMAPGTQHGAGASAKVLQKRRDRLIEANVRAKDLHQDLTAIGATGAFKADVVELAKPPIEHPRLVTAKTTTQGAQIEGALNFRMDLGKRNLDEFKRGSGAKVKLDGVIDLNLNLTGSFSHRGTTTQEFMRQPWLADVMSDRVAQDAQMLIKPQHFRLVGSSDDPDAANDSVDKLRQWDAGIAALRQSESSSGDADSKAKNAAALESIKQALADNIITMVGEYRMMIDLTNQIELTGQSTMRVVQKPGGGVKVVRKPPGGIQAVRKRLLARRGIADGEVAEYVKALSSQFAVLNRLYENIFPSDSAGRAQVPEGDRRFLNSMQESLEVPPMSMTKDQRRRAFGNEAAADKSRTKVTTVSVSTNLDIGLSRKKTRKPLTGPEVKQNYRSTGAGIGMKVTYIGSEKHSGLSGPAKSMSVIVSGNMSALKTSYLKDNQPNKSLGGANTKLFRLKAVRKKLGLSDDADLEEVMGNGFWAAVDQAWGPDGDGQVKLDFTMVNGKMRLKTTTAFESASRGIGGGMSIPVMAGGPNVAIDGSIDYSTTKVLSIYHADRTLAATTDALRANQSQWSDFRNQSALLRRQMIRLVQEDSNLEVQRRRGKTQDLAALLADIKAGVKNENGTSKDFGKIVKKNASATSPRPTVAAELVTWLTALKAGDEAEARAADTFIDVYLARRKAAIAAIPTAPTDIRMKQLLVRQDVQTIETAFNDVVVAKTKREDVDAEARFHKDRGTSRKELNDFVAHRIVAEMEKLESDVGKAENRPPAHPTSLDVTRARALYLFARQRTRKNFNLAKRAMALDYVSQTFDDLTKYNDPGDKAKALGMLVTDLDGMIKSNKVYVSPTVDAVASFSTKQSRGMNLRPVIKEGMESVVSPLRLVTDFERAQTQLQFDGTYPYVDNIRRAVSRAHFPVRWSGGARITKDGKQMKYVPAKHYDRKKKQAYYSSFDRKVGFTMRSRQDEMRRRGGKSIGATIQKLLDAQAKKREQEKRASIDKKKRRNRELQAAKT